MKSIKNKLILIESKLKLILKKMLTKIVLGGAKKNSIIQ